MGGSQHLLYSEQRFCIYFVSVNFAAIWWILQKGLLKSHATAQFFLQSDPPLGNPPLFHSCWAPHHSVV